MRNLLYLLPLALVLTLASCNTAAKATAAKSEMAPKKEMAEKAPSFAGTWSVTVEDTPLGTTTGKMILEEEDNGLKGTFVTADGKSLPLQNIKTTESGITTSFYFADYDVDVDVNLKGKPTDAILVGTSMGEYSTTAKRM
ncbi:hypothetical protein [Neolewinella persica]|uniref:hypothetical protein n=1 Tax=Neolewinella persica TaxID=70998 RepID=UPI00035F84EF|nr:hypothetical protein [Neolewinella persica]